MKVHWRTYKLKSIGQASSLEFKILKTQNNFFISFTEAEFISLLKSFYSFSSFPNLRNIMFSKFLYW